MNDEHASPPPEDHDDQSESSQLPKSPEELKEALKAIRNRDDTANVGEDTTEQPPTPTTEHEHDVEAVRQAAAEPVEVVTVPQLMIPRVRLSPRQIVSAVAAAVILIGAPITWVTWPRSVDIPEGAPSGCGRP